MKNKVLGICTTAAWVVVAGAAQAEITPSVTVKQKYTDNVYKQPKKEKHTWITEVKPGIVANAKQGGNEYELGANTEGGYYTVDSKNDYVDWSGYGKANLEFDRRNHLDTFLKRSHKHDEIGSEASEGSKANAQEEPDEYDQTDGDIKYTFGAKDAKGKLVLRDIYMSKNYTNNREDTAKLDRSENEYRATGYWRVMPKTSLLLEGRDKEIEYDKDYSNNDVLNRDYKLSSNEKRLFAGAEWEATAKTTGAVRLGHAWKDFDEREGDSAPVDDYSMPAWETTITWAPRSYSRFTWDSTQGPLESSSSGAFIYRTSNRIDWKHDWSKRLHSKLFYMRNFDEFVGTDRNDHFQTLGGGVGYDLTRQLLLTADYSYHDRNSNQDTNDYNSSMVTFGVKWEMK